MVESSEVALRLRGIDIDAAGGGGGEWTQDDVLLSIS
jgi:hypothetical protein